MAIKIRSGKKGIFFTFAAIVLAIVILLSFNAYNRYGLKDEVDAIETRITTMNDFIRDLEDDIENAIFISGFRSLLSLEDYLMAHNDITEPPKFLDDLGTSRNQAFDEVFREGTITGIDGTERMPIMGNNTFINWTTKMKNQSNRTGIELQFTIGAGDVSISQSGPWTVEVKINNLRIEVRDEKGTASWTITKDYTATINITSEIGSQTRFVDPLYLVYNDGLVNNTIRVTPVTDFSGAGLVTHLAIPDTSMGGSYYREHSDAPNYLMRFEGNLGPHIYGIESLVNTQKIKDQEDLGNLPPGTSKTKTAVDYIYYSSDNPSDDWIDGMEAYPWFYLDYSDPTCDPTSGHVLFYERICDIP